MLSLLDSCSVMIRIIPRPGMSGKTDRNSEHDRKLLCSQTLPGSGKDFLQFEIPMRLHYSQASNLKFAGRIFLPWQTTTAELKRGIGVLRAMKVYHTYSVLPIRFHINRKLNIYARDLPFLLTIAYQLRGKAFPPGGGMMPVKNVTLKKQYLAGKMILFREYINGG